MASARPLEMVLAFHSLVANVAELICTFRALQHVLATTLCANSVAAWTPRAEFSVYHWIVVKAHVRLDQLISYIHWQQAWILSQTLRVLFKVFLALGHVATGPAHEGPTLGALHMSASTFVFGDAHAALCIRTALSAKLEIQVI